MAAANDVLPKHEGVEVVYFAGIPLLLRRGSYGPFQSLSGDVADDVV